MILVISGPNENSQKASNNQDPDKDLYAESGQTLQGSFSAAAAAAVLGCIEAKICK